MDRPERLPDDVAQELEKLDSYELRAVSRYAERLAEQQKRLKESSDPVKTFFRGSDGNTYYETGGVWGSINLDDDT